MFKLPRLFSIKAALRGPGLQSLLGLSLVLSGGTAWGQTADWGGYSHSGCSGLVQLHVVDRTSGAKLPVYSHRGQYYVPGSPGHEYSLQVRNCTDQRVLAVVSVDGVNVVTGENAAAHQSGYVLDPYGTTDIQGWRKSMNNTAAFFFSDPSQAYATKTDRPYNLGVIGVAAFREKARVRMYEDEMSSSGNAVPSSAPKAKGGVDAASRSASEADASLGTGHGRKEYNPATRVEFERATNNPNQWVAVRYETRETLVARGVIPKPKKPKTYKPNPFPGDNTGFVPDP